MKDRTAKLVIYTALAVAFLLSAGPLLVGCTADQKQGAARVATGVQNWTKDPAVQQIAAAIPYGGVAVNVVGALAGLAAGVISQLPEKKAAQKSEAQTVAAVEKAFPTGKPDELKLSLAKTQSESTKRRVKKIKGE